MDYQVLPDYISFDLLTLTSGSFAVTEQGWARALSSHVFMSSVDDRLGVAPSQ